MKKLKGFKELITILLEEDYKPDLDGNWKSTVAVTAPVLYSDTLEECGNVISGDPSDYRETWLDTIIEYPCVMESKDTRLLVYFIREGEGVVVASGEEEEFERGYNTDSWNMALFELWAEVVRVTE